VQSDGNWPTFQRVLTASIIRVISHGPDNGGGASKMSVSTRLYGWTSQNTVTFIPAAVTTWNITRQAKSVTEYEPPLLGSQIRKLGTHLSKRCHTLLLLPRSHAWQDRLSLSSTWSRSGSARRVAWLPCDVNVTRTPAACHYTFLDSNLPRVHHLSSEVILKT
jgi:hypothetical protein